MDVSNLSLAEQTLRVGTSVREENLNCASELLEAQYCLVGHENSVGSLPVRRGRKEVFVLVCVCVC